MCVRERYIYRERERERQTNRQTDGCTNGQVDRRTDMRVDKPLCTFIDPLYLRLVRTIHLYIYMVYIR